MSSSCACSCKYLHCSLPLLVTQDPQVLQSCLARGSVARLGRGGSTSDLRRRLCRCLAVHIRSTVTERKLSRRDVQFILCTIETVCYFSQTPNSELENGVAIFRGSSFSQNPMSKLGFWINGTWGSIQLPLFNSEVGSSHLWKFGPIFQVCSFT